MTVYGDLYFLLNGGVDFVLLLAAGRMGRARSTVWRLLLASAAGAAYATAQLWALHAWVFGPAGQALASAGMVALAYAPLPARRLLVLCAYLYAGAAFVAGATLAVSFAAAAGWGGGLSVWLAGGPGGRWTDIPWWALAAALCGALLAARAWLARTARQPWVVGLRIAVDGAAASCRGLVDTGNRLIDPLGAGPVVVVEAGALAPLLPPELAAALDDVEAAALAVGGTPWERRLRLIPFRALGSDGGLLVGFRPDRIDVDPDPAGYGGVAGAGGPAADPPGYGGAAGVGGPAADPAGYGGAAGVGGPAAAGGASRAALRAVRPAAFGDVTVAVTVRRLDPSGEVRALVPSSLAPAGPPAGRSVAGRPAAAGRSAAERSTAGQARAVADGGFGRTGAAAASGVADGGPGRTAGPTAAGRSAAERSTAGQARAVAGGGCGRAAGRHGADGERRGAGRDLGEGSG